PKEVFTLSLGEAGAGARDIQARYQSAPSDAFAASAKLGEKTAGDDVAGNETAQYLLPLAARTRALFKMEVAEAAYIIEQRTQPAGHFSYRHVAWDMYQELQRQLPSLTAFVRAVDPNQVVDLFRR